MPCRGNDDLEVVVVGAGAITREIRSPLKRSSTRGPEHEHA
jgi:hypothetical protein